MKKSRLLNILLTMMMLINTFLTPQMAYSISAAMNDGETEESETIDPEEEDETIVHTLGESAEGESTDTGDTSQTDGTGDGTEGTDVEPTAEVDEDTGENEEEVTHGVDPPVEPVAVVTDDTDKKEETPTLFGRILNAGKQAIRSLSMGTNAVVGENLVSSFEMTINNSDNSQTVVEDGADLELDVTKLESVVLKYGITKPDNLYIANGATYTIDLPDFYGGTTKDQSIIVEGVQVATYDIADGKIIVTFNEVVNDFDDVEMFANVSGTFNTEIFETEEEVLVSVPYSEGGSFTATLRPKQKEYVGEDRKSVGTPYVLNENGSKTDTTHNPTHVEWTVIANDSAGSFANATIVDDLGNSLEIVPGSFVIEKINRDYKNEETGREVVDGLTPKITATGFELALGSIENAYEITYTTSIIGPAEGGPLRVNNNANIILDGTENNISDGFDGTWSKPLPTITKEGNLVEGKKDVIEWQVEYNYGKNNLGDVTLTDVLSHGEVLSDTIKVYEVNPDLDGNVSELGEPTSGTFPLSLDAEGKAYYITFESSVPAGLNDTVINTVSDSLNPENSDNASVPVDTIPEGEKVGNQKVDDAGKPYIEWTITMNSSKVDVPTINVKDVFNKTHLDFDVKDTDLYMLTRDGEPVTLPNDSVSLTDYEHTDGREGFQLNIEKAGPHEYKFIYKTYYTVLGMNEEQVANEAELVFLDGEGEGIGETITPDVNINGPKAGITKIGAYSEAISRNEVEEGVHRQLINWTIDFNTSKILLNNPTLKDTFSSKNYEYIADSFDIVTVTVDEDGKVVETPFTNYTFTQPINSDGFEIKIDEETNAVFRSKFDTTADDINNKEHKNEADLTWQGGTEHSEDTVRKRDAGIEKSAEVITDADGNKSINWKIKFNTHWNVISDFKLTDKYTPADVRVSNFKVYRDNGWEDAPVDLEVGTDYTLTGPEDGQFTIAIDQLLPMPYYIEYTTSLSPQQEAGEVKNTANITYTGGEGKTEITVPKPLLQVTKEATNLNKEPDKPVISWEINANTDSERHFVNLVDAVLTDTIPGDQKLIADSIQVRRAGTAEDIASTLDITRTDNSFSIPLPNGPYQYVVTFNTEILEYPSFNEQIDRYTNSTTLSNKNHDPVTDGAHQDYFKDGDDGLIGKSGEQNAETEDIDWTVSVNKQGLTINNPTITDELSDLHAYLVDTIKVMHGDRVLIKDTDYTLVMAEDNRNFTMTFKDNVITEEVSLSYSTRLNADFIGSRDVTNLIKLTGGSESKDLDVQKSTTTATQWFYGGGGSGRTVQFQMNKETEDGSPLQGVKFTLDRQPISGDPVAVDAEILTNENGLYVSADNLRAGQYILTEVDAPEGFKALDGPIYFTLGYAEPGSEDDYVITIMDSEWNKAENQNANALGNVLTVTNEYEEGVEPEPSVSVGDYVWIDENKDGLQDDTDTPLAGVVLTIEDEEGNPVTDVFGNLVGTRTTDKNGWYSFDNLPIDNTYTVRIDKDASAEALGNLVPTLNNEGDDNTIDSSTWEATSRRMTVDKDRDPTLDFGFIAQEFTTIKGEKIWDDANNQDGIRPESSKIKLLAKGTELVTQKKNREQYRNWKYVFENVPVYVEGTKATYTVSEEPVEGYIVSYPGTTIKNSHTPEVINLSGKKTWEDANNQDGKRPDSIIVRLFAGDDEVGSKKVTSADNWSYEFTGIPKFAKGEVGSEINYTIQEDKVEGYSTKIKGMNITNSYTPGKTSVNVIKAWNDKGNLESRPESITVNLLANEVKTNQKVKLNAGNNWQADFTNLDEYANGKIIDYTIQEEVPEDFVVVSVEGNATNGFRITNRPAKVSVGDYVWIDENNDGLQDGTDTPLQGIVLILKDLEGNVITKDVYGNPVKPQVTDENGYYSFDDLPINNYYTVEIDREASKESLKGLMPTLEEVGENKAEDSSTWSAKSDEMIEDGQHDPKLDFGFVRKRVSVGDYVWIDVNRDGLQDDTDVVIPGVVLELVDSNDKPVTDVFGEPVGPTTTDDSGKYTFDNLPADETYTVRINQKESAEALKDLVPTIEIENNIETDSSTWEETSRLLTEDEEHDPTLDFGFVRKRVSVGDYVWIDVNHSGLQDETDIYLEGVTLILKDEEGNIVTVDVDGNPVVPQVTDENGFYIFENLPADRTYRVEVDREAFERDFPELVPTIEDAGERPVSSSTWFTDSVLLTDDGQHDPTLDFGFIRKHVSVGDYVWLDENKDGLQDDGEPGIPGVVLVITDEDGNPVTDVFGNPVGPTTTDENGRYTFDHLPINNKYIVSIDREASEKALKDLMTTLENAGDRAIDSSTWTAISVFLDQHEQRDPTLDFGFILVDPEPAKPVVPEDPEKGLPATGEEATNFLLGASLLALGGLLVVYNEKWFKKKQRR